jgi:AcrR family transcriptional regulator
MVGKADRDATSSVRSRLVDAAVRLLADEGPGAIQARRLAKEIGASTMAVYHHFGGMPELLAAVSDEGFRKLGARLESVPDTEDAVADLCRRGLAYRAAAQDNRHLYDLMFGLSAPGGYRPLSRETAPPDTTDQALEAASSVGQAAFGHLVSSCARAIESGRINGEDPMHAASQLWSILHGYVTLELAGHFGQLDGLTEVFFPLSINVLIGLGDTRERATYSAMDALRLAGND